MKPSEYFNGLEWKVIRDENGCRHYHLPECQVDVLHVPHPNNMRWEGGESPFRITLVSWLQELNLFIKPDSFFQGGIESSFAKSIINGMPALCKNDKFMALEYISHELAKGNCIMSVRTLSEIINAMGLKTNYGTSFMGGRGTYRLIMSAYWRLERQGKHIEAIALARSFVRPNGHYAYAADPHIAIRANN
jgi:hypothetical protein